MARRLRWRVRLLVRGSWCALLPHQRGASWLPSPCSLPLPPPLPLLLPLPLRLPIPGGSRSLNGCPPPHHCSSNALPHHLPPPPLSDCNMCFAARLASAAACGHACVPGVGLRLCHGVVQVLRLMAAPTAFLDTLATISGADVAHDPLAATRSLLCVNLELCARRQLALAHPCINA